MNLRPTFQISAVSNLEVACSLSAAYEAWYASKKLIKSNNVALIQYTHPLKTLSSPFPRNFDSLEITN